MLHNYFTLIFNYFTLVTKHEAESAGINFRHREPVVTRLCEVLCQSNGCRE